MTFVATNMKPLKLYTRITLLVSAILISVLLAVVYFFVTKAREIEVLDQEEKARRFALQLANSLPEISEGLKLAEIRKVTLDFRQLNASQNQILQIRIYNKSLNEVFNITDAPKEEIPAKELAKLGKQQPSSRARTIVTKNGRQEVIDAYAPLLDTGKLVGVVAITISRSELTGLSQQLIRLTVALLAVAIISITALLYFLFSQVIYRPVDDLLKTMREAETGNLEVAAPVPDNAEFGQLASGFNHMLSRLRVMTEERAKYQKRLEERVTEATAELEDRNSQLEIANTELFEIQRELTKFERLAAAGQLAAQFAHEVGTPLNLISGHVQLLTAKTEDQRTRERLELIASQIARIEKIVRNMLDATRRPRPTLAATDLNALLQKMFEVTAPTLAARDVTLKVELDERNPVVLADGEQLQQVFINLINNSLDAMPNGGELFFSTTVQKNTAMIICRDNGIGISPEVKERIFDPLFTTKSHGHGSGLGLTVVHKIIQEHGGNILLKSDIRQGTEFQITLPLASSNTSVVSRPMSVAAEAKGIPATNK